MKINKWAIILGILGGLYALIPGIQSIQWLINYGTAGDPGPFGPYMSPYFWPIGIVALIFGTILIFLFSYLKDNQLLLYSFINIVNVFLWVVLGILIGILIGKIKK